MYTTSALKITGGRTVCTLTTLFCPLTMASAKAYLEKHKVEEAITDAIAQVVNERPDDALSRIGELLKRKAGPKKLLDTVRRERETFALSADTSLPSAKSAVVGGGGSGV